MAKKTDHITIDNLDTFLTDNATKEELQRIVDLVEKSNDPRAKGIKELVYEDLAKQYKRIAQDQVDSFIDSLDEVTKRIVSGVYLTERNKMVGAGHSATQINTLSKLTEGV